MPQIKITDLIDNAVENALARREEVLTTEETNQIQGGFAFLPINGIKPKPPIVMGKITIGIIRRPWPIKSAIM